MLKSDICRNTVRMSKRPYPLFEASLHMDEICKKEDIGRDV